MAKIQVHLIRDSLCADNIYRDVFQKLRSTKGLITFSNSLNELGDSYPEVIYPDKGELIYLNFTDFYEICEAYRTKHAIPKEDHIFLLTGANNSLNWFANMDHDGHNYFIQTTEWELFFGDRIEANNPIAYEVMAWLVRRKMFENEGDMMDNIHLSPRGCLMDFCQNKKDIILKMRTADVCPECLETIRDRDISIKFLNQVFTLWEDIRKNIVFRERTDFLSIRGRLVIDINERTLSFPDYDNINFTLPPRELTFYLMYLQEINGIRLVNLIDHLETLKHIYSSLTPNDDEQIIRGWLNPMGNVPSQIISKINRIIKGNLGENIADYFTIRRTGRDESHRISIDREFVTIG